MGAVRMANLFLRVLAVSLAVSLLLLTLLLCGCWLEKRYAPQTRRWLWLAVAWVLLAAPWLPKPHAPVVVEAPAYELSLPAASKGEPAAPVGEQPQPILPPENQPQPLFPAQSGIQGETQLPAQPQTASRPVLPAASQPAEARRPTLSLTALAAGIWLAGLAFVLLWQGGRYLLIRRRLLRCSKPVTGLARYAAELGLEDKVAFYLCEAVPGPMTLGIFRPLVLFPAAKVAPAALRHELYHIKRRDVGYKTLLLLSCALHWFNPLAWLMLRAADRDVEACCDAEVVAGRDNDYKRSYGELLLSAAAETRTLPFTTSFGGSAGQMKARLTQLFRPGKRSRALVCAVLALAVALGSLVACQQTAPTPPEEGKDAPNVEAAAQPLTERTMPTLTYYDPARDFLLYHTLDTAYFHYGDSHEEFCPDQGLGRRVLWRCDVSEDETTVYLSHVFDDSDDRDERFYAWDIDARTLTQVDSIPPGEDHTTHVDWEELYNSGFVGATDLRSNALKTADGIIVALTIDSNLGDGTLPYLCFTRMEPDKSPQSRFLTPEKIPAPRDYTDPDWGFVLRLPESMEGNYVVSRTANGWSFYAKDLYPKGMGYLFSLWAEDFDTQQMTIDSQGGLWSGKIPGEKNGITYVLATWNEEATTPAEQENKTYMTMLRDAWNITADDLNLTGVTRSTGWLWPLHDSYTILRPFTKGEHEGVDIQAAAGESVQAIGYGVVTEVLYDQSAGSWTVRVAHDDIFTSEYGHIQNVWVEPGDTVYRGKLLGEVCAGDGQWYLHFAWDMGGPWDPMQENYKRYDFSDIAPSVFTIVGDPRITDALQSVLRGELDFYDTEEGTYRNVNHLGDSDGVPVSVYRYAQLDMDNDTIPEVVLWLRRGEDPYQLGSIILHYQKGGVYGYPMGYRSMNLLNLKRDGAYNWSGGASNNGWGKKDFYRNETINQPEEGQAAKPDVVWYQWGGGAYLTLHLADGRFLEVRLLTTEPDKSYFPVHRIEVYEGNTLLQTIDTATLPQPEEYAWDGCFVNRGYTVGEPVVKDLNFDGSQDFGLLAVSGYPHNVPYNYFLWNGEKNCFEYAFTRLSELEPDPTRRELVETEYSTTGDIQNRYAYTGEGSLRKVR